MYVPHILLYNVFPKEEFVGYMNVLFLSVMIDYKNRRRLVWGKLENGKMQNRV